MNKLQKQRSSHLLLLAVLLFSLPASAEDYAPITVPMEVKQVSEHAYYVNGKAGIATDNEGFISNAGFVVTDEGVVVFDALGTPSLAAALLERIRKITDQPVKYVVMSHYHADHIYGLQVFKDLGAEVYAPQGSLDYIHSEAAEDRLFERQLSLKPWVNENTRIVVPDTIISGLKRFSLGGLDFTINYLGKAHSEGDLAMLVEQDRVLFSGDIIFEGRVPFVGNANTRHWLKTLTELETGGLAALVPGHGPASKNPASTISLTRRYLAYLRETMGAAIDDLTPFDEAYAEVDWSEFENVPAFKEANRINAYQVYLSMGKELFEN
ncbi:MAG: MBL fold metallo-hydrolase [Gammaproteobacteria bacterium]|nr:MBL fold metallo-hydrolase [Gammaproteobacteria bacterium]